MEHDPLLNQLIDFFTSHGYVGEEAVQEAKKELQREAKSSNAKGSTSLHY